MNKEEKTKMDHKVKDVINELVKPGNKQNAAIYFRGDSEFQNASLYMKGDPALLANTMQHHMLNNDIFRRLMLASVGSLIARNPQIKFEFEEGLKLIETIPGSN